MSLARFEELLNEVMDETIQTSNGKEMLELYNKLLHSPFIGLVKEMGKTTCFDGAATLARPISLQISLASCSP